MPSFQTEFDFDALIVSKTDDEWNGGTSGRGIIRRKLRERRWGQVKKTMTVIAPEIILNERGLGSDL